MTNVPNPVKVKTQECFTWGATDNEKGEIAVDIKSEKLCAKVWAMPGLAQLKTNIQSTDGGKSANKLRFGGQGVSFEGAAASGAGNTQP